MSASPPALTDVADGNADAQASLAANILGGDNSDEDMSDNEGPARPRRAFPKAPSEAAPEDTNEESTAVTPQAEETGVEASGGDVDMADATARTHSPTPVEGTEEQGEEAPPAEMSDASDDSEDAYDPDRIPKFKKSKKRTSDNEDEDEMEQDDGARKKKKGDKRRKKDKSSRRNKRDANELGEEDVNILEGEQEEEMDEATRKRIERETKIDAIGKTKKQVRRRKKGEEDIMDSAYEDMCTTLRNKMLEAHSKDVQSRRRREPALAKLNLLEEVMGVLRNQTMWQAIVDSQLLEAVRQWLEPSYLDPTPSSHPTEPRWSLPAVGIQKAIFEVLPKMELDTPSLKESRLGPVVLFYTRSKRPPAEVKRAAEALMQVWSRPIIKRPNDFRERTIQTATQTRSREEGEEGGEGDMEEDGEERGQGSQSQGGASQSQGATVRKIFNYNAALEENKGRKGARLPVVKSAQYTIAPEQKSQASDSLQHLNRLQSDNKKFNKFARSMKMASKK